MTASIKTEFYSKNKEEKAFVKENNSEKKSKEALQAIQKTEKKEASFLEETSSPSKIKRSTPRKEIMVQNHQKQALDHIDIRIEASA